MQPPLLYPVRLQLAVVAACLLLAAYLPVWHKLWFVAESGHFGGGTGWVWLLLLGLYQRWRLALGFTYMLLTLQLLLAGYILSQNIPTGGPTLGFLVNSSLYLLAGCILYFSSDLKQYFSQLPADARL
ncbi:MAG: hypothetical protein ACRYF0_10925 [Janthinobacterium lividum]